MRKLLIPSFLATLFLSNWLAQSTLGVTFDFVTFMGQTGLPGSNDGGDGAARFNNPKDVALDNAGNVYVADTSNNTIRKITPAGIVSTLAGLAGVAGSADGTGSDARFRGPYGVAVDAAGNVYVADTFNNTIRKITPTGVVSTLAGLAGSIGHIDGIGSDARFSECHGVTVDSGGNLYVADGDGTVRKITPAGLVSTFAGGFSGAQDMAVDSAGNVYVANSFGHSISKITPAGDVSTLAGMPGVAGSDDGTGSAARFYECGGVAVDNVGNVYVGDTFNHTIRKITPSGAVTTLAGLAGSAGNADGAGSVARFNLPAGLAVNPAGDLYVGDAQNEIIRKITPAGDVSTLAGSANSTTAAKFSFPQGVAVDNAVGNVYVADSNNHIIRQITPDGAVSTLAGSPGMSGSADGLGSAASFNSPIGVAVDSSNNVYVGDTFNHTIRKITPDGNVNTLAGFPGSSGSIDGTGSAARFNLPIGVAVDGPGNVYVADAGNHTIRKITPGGLVSTFAGLPGSLGSVDGTGSSARFNSPFGVAVDGAGNVYVADTGNNTFRKVTPAGVVSTLAGLPGSTGTADGAGSAARFNVPQGVTVDNTGNLYAGDTSNNEIRKITPSGVVSTVVAGVSFVGPRGVAVQSDGRLYVANTNQHTILVGTDTSAFDVSITSPLVATGTIGQPFVYQFETIGATSLAVTNLPPGLTFDPALSAITGKTTAAGTFQVGLTASNSQRSTGATLSVTVETAPPIGPIITSSSAATGKVGQPFQFQVTTTGASSSATLSASGLPPGLSVNSVTGLISGTPASEGSVSVTLTVTDGSFSTSATLQITISTDPALPVIVSSNTALLTPGQSFTYTINAPGSSNPSDPTSYSLVFTLPNGLFFDAQTGTISGTFTGSAAFGASAPNRPDLSGGIVSNVQLFASNSHGTSTLPLIFFLAPTGAVNIATRIAVGINDNVLIAGFIITGNAPKKVVIRAIGPSLPFPGALQDPTLKLHDAGSLLGTNNNWRDTQESEINGTGIPPTDQRESAILAYLNPGNYTAVVRGANNATGIAVVEVYDLGTASLDSSSNAKLAQISTRGTVLTGDNVMIGGFIIKQEATKVIVRAIGPSLSAFGVDNALQDPTLELHDGSGATIMSNDDWRTTQEQQIIDTTVPPKDDRESAIVQTLSPGAYTAIVRGKGDKTGVALVEVYGLQ